LGTTSEFDAMVVGIINRRDTTSGDGDPDEDPIMAIREVWDAKATLDPFALLDVLDKKVESLHKILDNKTSHIINLSDLSSFAGDSISSFVGMNQGGNKNADEGAYFVVLPSLENKDTDTNLSPMVYRVGIESPQTTKRNYDDDPTPDDESSNIQSPLPHVGVFASRMISPGASARRIQTMVYERLLETDLATVKGLLHCHQHNTMCGNNEDRLSWETDHEHFDLHTHQQVQDRSINIVKRLLQLIHKLRPTVVVGTLPPKS